MISVSEMHEIERKAVNMGISEELLMETAGANAASVTDSEFRLQGKEVMIFCGTGNNAGDGLVFARYALIYGASVKVYFVCGTGSLKPLPSKHHSALRRQEKVVFVKRAEDADILVDAMLGTGIKGRVSEEYARAIREFNSMNGIKLSLDNPSGIDCDTGEVLGEAVKPDMTITFHARKKGMNEKNSGRIVVAGIGIPKI
ncbi:MAG: NAD(P)H-hydrate epimerase [Candidatus Aenigmatarchaeota archaeon]|nr:MAG: NAD(P)H-hydrate epimerase [Candidatus Aenigmarchaeota archaeon]